MEIQYSPKSSLVESRSSPMTAKSERAMDQLIRKNILLFRRNGKAVFGEAFLTILYFGILILLAQTVTTTVHDPIPIPDNGYPLYGGSSSVYSSYTYVYGCVAGDPSKNCTDGSWDPGNIGFSDSNDGCSSSLMDLKDNHVDVCNPSFVAYFQTPNCICVPNSTVETYSSVVASNLTAAFIFNPANVQDFTAHVSDTPSFDPLFTSPYNPRPPDWNSQKLGALLQPLYNGILSYSPSSPMKDLEFMFTLKQMGTQEWEETGAGAMTNFPMYLCVVFMSSTSTIVIELMNERKRKNDQGLIMSGTSPVTYFGSWFVMALARQSITVFFSTLFSYLFFVPYTSPLITLMTFTVMAIYAIFFGLTFAMKFTGSKQAQNFLIWSTIVSTAPIYAQSNLFLDATATTVIPPQVSLGISCVLPQFAMANLLAEMLIRNNKYDNGVNFSNMFRESRLGYSFSTFFLLLIVGLVVQGVLIFKFVIKSGYVSSSDAKASDEAFRKELGNYDSDVAVSIRDLQKSFDNGAVTAVDGLTVDFKMNEITSFLGHNGAGKTTTIQILTGLHEATGGDAFVFGKSIVHNMDAVREIISVCPQENILWDTLTVEEHCILWFGIRKVPVSDALVMQSLSEVGLHDKIDSKASDLSGGQKRKLMVALAFIGDPKIVYLDEPTAGMDTQARRDIWDLLRRKKEGRAIVLTTHFMDEADILGDRIAILHSGKLQVVGTSEELKDKFGAGNHLNVSVAEVGNRRKIFEIIRGVIPNATLDVPDEVVDNAGNFVQATDVEDHLLTSSSGDVGFVIPGNVGTSDLAKLCRRLDKAKSNKEHGFSAYGFMSTTLEEVFIKLGEMEGTGAGNGALERHSSLEGFTTNVNLASPLLPKITYKKPSSAKKVWFILQRRFICESRNLKGFIFNAIIPVAFVCVMIAMLQIDYYPDPDPPELLSLDAVSLLLPDNEFGSGRFQLPIARNGSLPTALNDALSDIYTYQGEISSLPFATDVTDVWEKSGNYGCFEAYLIMDNSGLCEGEGTTSLVKIPPFSATVTDPAIGARMGGISVANVTNYLGETLSSVTVFFNTSISTSMLGLTTYVYDSFINDGVDSMLLPKAYPLPDRPPTPEEQEAQDRLNSILSYSIAPMFLVYGFLALPSQIVYDIVSERKSGLKHLHILMGVKPSEYWAANYVWDLTSKWFFTCPLAMVTMAIGAPDLANLSTYVILVSFIASATAFAYAFTFAFDEPNIASGWTTNALMLGFIFSYAIVLIIQLPSMNVDDATKGALTNLGMVVSPGQSLMSGLSNYLMCNAFKEDPWQWNVDNEYVTGGVLQPVVYLWCQFILFSTILVFCENKAIGKCFDPMLKCYHYATRWIENLFFKKAKREVEFEEEEQAVEVVEDEDVKDERSIIDDRNYKDEVQSSIKIVHLRKQFLPQGSEEKGTVAVDDLCLRIRPGECFALLGTNGAGKSTTLNMLLRVLNPTSGQAYVNGVDVTKTEATNSLFLDMGYCPQTNALFELMTGEEMLDFFTKIRGVSDESRPNYVKNCINNANLQAHATKRCGKYSGGNKRKLCFAIAICGEPSMTVLDESSAGVDVAARKKLWAVLQSLLSRGNTVIMTTHHMEEAQHLAHRAAIMVDGKLACLGTAQHLQEKYGGGYELSIFAAEGANMDSLLVKVAKVTGRDCDELERTDDTYVRLGLGKSEEGLEHEGLEHEGLERGSFSIADIFELMAAEKLAGNVESYTLTQMGLEEVFLSLTQSRSRRGKRVRGEGGEMFGSGEGGGQNEAIIDVINLAYTPFKGLKRNTQVPQELAEKGVTQAEWEDYVVERLTKVSKMIGCTNTQTGCCALCPMFVVPPLTCLACVACKTQAAPYDNELANWQDAFNQDVLEPKGVFCKTQSVAEKVTDMTGQKSDRAKVSRWIAFAYSETAIKKLKADPHTAGKMPDYRLLGGFNTANLVIHPGDFKEIG